MIFAYLAAAFVAAAAAWLFGSLIARAIGAFYVLRGLAGMLVYGTH
ncbi:hypothetical protein OS121_28825 [Mycolicibacterium mucogenicum]|nr:hypothetical protein [Mycolicibacterium mucogenicum]MCX8559049.1 hypothetical protein [Mycolicibacterium mucogenicum]